MRHSSKYLLFTLLISIFNNDKLASWLGVIYSHAAFQNGWTLSLTTEKTKDAVFAGPGGNTRDLVFGSKKVSSKAPFFQPGFRDGKAGCSPF